MGDQKWAKNRLVPIFQFKKKQTACPGKAVVTALAVETPDPRPCLELLRYQVTIKGTLSDVLLSTKKGGKIAGNPVACRVSKR